MCEGEKGGRARRKQINDRHNHQQSYLLPHTHPQRDAENHERPCFISVPGEAEGAARFCPDLPPRRLKTEESPWLPTLGLFPDPGESDPSLSNTEDFLELSEER